MRIKILIPVSMFVLALFIPLEAQWAATYGGSDYDYLRFVLLASDGGYIVGGVFYATYEGPRFLILKLTASGDIEWQKKYGAEYYDDIYFKPTSDGGYIAAGETYSFDAGGYDIWLLKLTSSGDIDWQKACGGSGDDHVRSIQPTTDGGYIAAGETYSFGAGSCDIWLLKLTSSGDVEWQKTYGGSGGDYVDFLQPTLDGGYVVAGTTSSFGEGEQEIWLLKLTSSGDVEWQKAYGGNGGEDIHFFQLPADGGYIVASQYYSFDTGYDIWLIKLTSSGDIEWQKACGGSGDDHVRSIQPTTDGGYIAAGETYSFGAGSCDIWLLKLKSSGDVEWQKAYGGSGGDFVCSLQPTTGGGYIVAGNTNSFGTESGAIWGIQDIFVLKLSLTGEVVWQKTYGGNFSWDAAASIQQIDSGNFVLSGETQSWGSGGEIWVLELLPDGEISPLCAFVRTPNAEITDINILPVDSGSVPKDTSAVPAQTNVIPQDTDISPQESNVTTYRLGSERCELTLYSYPSAGGTIQPGRGTHTYDTGTEITLKATPTPGSDYVFSSWSGNVNSTNPQINITMDGNKTITASFYDASASDEWGDGWGDHSEECFIATAAYDSPLHPYVRILRKFRDRYLITNKPGRAFVNFYYKYSPGAAGFIARHSVLKIPVRIHLLPFVVFGYSMVKFGPVIALLLPLSIFGLTTIFAFVFRHIKKIRKL